MAFHVKDVTRWLKEAAVEFDTLSNGPILYGSRASIYLKDEAGKQLYTWNDNPQVDEIFFNDMDENSVAVTCKQTSYVVDSLADLHSVGDLRERVLAKLCRPDGTCVWDPAAHAVGARNAVLVTLERACCALDGVR
jgi:hypothetical protein